jgi:membrane-bound lytic murein transglycosylase D
LAIVESALNPKAVSKMGATGLWQFMYQTGKQYGLKSILILMNEATHCERVHSGAVHDNMYKMFGDWDLVLASYSGPGNVKPSDVRVGSKIIGTSEKSSERNARICPRFLATMYIYSTTKNTELSQIEP